MTENSPSPVAIPFKSLNLSKTLIWSLAIGVVFSVIQLGIAAVYVWANGSQINTKDFSSQIVEFQSDSTLISVMILATGVVCSAMIFLIVRNREISVCEYLGLNPVSAKHFVGWALALIVFSFLAGYAATYFEQDIVTDFSRSLYANADNIVLLILAVTIAAPIFEELFFRGFIYAGISHSRLGVVGAIVITALIWTMIHGQYDWYVKGNIFLLGILFGIARYKSGSLLPPLLMHMLMNASALIEVANQ